MELKCINRWTMVSLSLCLLVFCLPSDVENDKPIFAAAQRFNDIDINIDILSFENRSKSHLNYFQCRPIVGVLCCCSYTCFQATALYKQTLERRRRVLALSDLFFVEVSVWRVSFSTPKSGACWRTFDKICKFSVGFSSFQCFLLGSSSGQIEMDDFDALQNT